MALVPVQTGWFKPCASNEGSADSGDKAKKARQLLHKKGLGIQAVDSRTNGTRDKIRWVCFCRETPLWGGGVVVVGCGGSGGGGDVVIM